MNQNKQFPKGWSDIKVDQFIEYILLKEESFDSFFDYETEVFQILLDNEFDDIEDYTITEFDNIRKQFNFRYKLPTNKIKYNIGLYKYKGIDALTFGEFIDMEYYITSNLYQYLPNICAIMWRKTKEDDWGNVIIEPYSNIDINNRIEDFKLIPITDVYGVIDEYTKFKELFLDTYNLLFDEPINDEQNFDEFLTEEDKKELEKEEAMKKFSWEFILYKLANGDITKYDYILGLPLIFVFNQLSFQKSANL